MAAFFVGSMAIAACVYARKSDWLKFHLRHQPMLMSVFGGVMLLCGLSPQVSPLLPISGAVMLLIGVSGMARWPRRWWPTPDEVVEQARAMSPFEAVGRAFLFMTAPYFAVAVTCSYLGDPILLTWPSLAAAISVPLCAGLHAWRRDRQASRTIATNV